VFLFSADPLELCQVEWGSVAAQLISGLSRDVQTKKMPLLQCLGCVFMVVVLLEGELSTHTEVLRALETVFLKDLSVLCSVHLSLKPD
jgi:hypothetical protein